LGYILHPTFELLNLINMVVNILSTTSITQKCIFLTIILGTEINSLFLVDSTQLLNWLVYEAKFLLERESIR